MATVLLGIESSCDDTAAAVLVDGVLASSVVSSQAVHEAYGGVVPELASRDHQRLIVPIVDAALRRAGAEITDLSAVAVTYGPGLAGSLLVGVSFAKALAASRYLPLIAVNHLEGHIYSVFLEDEPPPFPHINLTVSGGHTQLAVIDKDFNHKILGKTRDDAAGEAFDKVAKLLGLGFPGGPAIDRLAKDGDPEFVQFPRSRPDTFSFSFSGIKTSVRYYLAGASDGERHTLLTDRLADVCASFQRAVVDVLSGAIVDAVAETGIRHVAVTGGVSANRELGQRLREEGRQHGFSVHIPRPSFCTDNAAMIAKAGEMKWLAGEVSPLTLTAEPNLVL